MPPNNVSTWLDFAIQQIAAESYLDNVDFTNTAAVRLALIRGNNRTGFDPPSGPLLGKTQLTNALADRFLATYEIVDQHSNDATGFSATLLKNRDTGEYTLSFRSTEYRNTNQGGDFERDGLDGADGDIKDKGFAFGQLAAMEQYYQELRAPGGKLPTSAVLNVTGYSLGGHLATIFTELHSADITQTYTFNGAGRGHIIGPEATEGERIRRMVDIFKAALLDPDALPAGMSKDDPLYQPAKDQAMANPGWQPFAGNSPLNAYDDPRYAWARRVALLAYGTTGVNLVSLPPPGEVGQEPAFAKITQLFGHATSNDREYVANSGVHGSATSIFIEDQPNLDGFGGFFDSNGDFGTTHSITLMVDSLALMEAFQAVDPNVTQTTLEQIFSASSNEIATGITVGLSGTAEADSVEHALDALRKVFLGPVEKTDSNPATGGFGDLAFRNPFYDNIATLQAALNAARAADPTQIFTVASLVPTPEAPITVTGIANAAQADNARGVAYRYALQELNPFVVEGVDYTVHGQNGALDVAVFTNNYLTDRATFLANKIEINKTDGAPNALLLPTVHFKDIASGYEISPAENAEYEIVFGGDGSDAPVTAWGDSGPDHLYGGGGDDVIKGLLGDDYIEGNIGNDTLIGGGNNDTLLGGPGFDTYIYNAGDGNDKIEDSDGRGEIIADHQLLVGGVRLAGATEWVSLDGKFHYRLSGTDLIASVSGNELTINQNFTSGQLGIKLFNLPDFDANGFPTRTSFTRVVSNPDGTTSTVPFFDDNSNDTRLPALQPDLSGNTNNLIHALGGGDFVLSGPGNDQVFGDDGNDQLLGEGGDDRLFGGAGSDILIGDDSADPNSGGADFLDGSDGNDLLQGNAGNDVLLGGGGNDNLNGDDPLAANTGNNDDWLDSGEGNDELHGAAGSDVLIGGPGDDLLIGDTTQFQGGTPEMGGNDTLDGGDGIDQLYGLYGDDVLEGGLGNDFLAGQDGSDVLYGDDGNDTLSGDLRIDFVTGLYDTSEFRGAGANDLLDGGAGNDILHGGEGDDVLVGGSGDDVIFGDYNFNLIPIGGPLRATLVALGGNDVLDGGEGNDRLFGGAGDDTLLGGADNDILLGGDGNDTLDGGEGIDSLDGGSGQDILHAGGGSDFLAAGSGNSVLFGDEGDDRLDSGGYNGFGNAVLEGGAGNDTYMVDSVADTVIEAADEGTDSIFASSLSGSISYTLSENVENISWANAGAGALTFIGNDLDNTLSGDKGFTLDGRGGNDALNGFNGGTTFIFAPGGGQDTVRSFDGASLDFLVPDTLQLQDVLPSDVTVVRNVDNVVISRNGTTDQVTIQSFFTFNGFNPGNTFPHQVEQVQFEDGTVWGIPALTDKIVRVTGTDGADELRGFDNKDDTILGFAGDDTLVGLSGNDVLDGGPGNDILIGGPGSDSYIFNLGDGVDTIEDHAEGGQGGGNAEAISTGNTVVFGDGITQADLTLEQQANSLIIHYGSLGDAIQLTDFDPTNVNGSLVVDTLEFADGNLVNLADLFAPANTAPTVTNPIADLSTAEDSAFSFIVPAYTFADPDAGDVLTLSASLDSGDPLPAWLGFDAQTRTFSGTPDDPDVGALSLKVTATDTGNLSAADTFGLTVTPATVHVLTGTGRNDVIRGSSGKDVINAKGGNDHVYAGAGNDTVRGGKGDDRLFGETGDDALAGGKGDDLLDGGAGDDLLKGGKGDDTVLGGAGDDTLRGGKGKDTLQGGLGNDTYLFNRGHGQDTISENDTTPGNTDTAAFASGINPIDLVLSRQAKDLHLAIHGSTDQMTVQNWYKGSANQIEVIQAGDGSQLLNTQVDQLIQAMAQFSAATGLTWDQAIDQRPQDVQTILAASWQ